ncbi:hypothetical protein C8P63_11114 [Melghirimyces profundicolus]|uniref:Uncharacterized protein n=1 Tax=Melghirimyces profundicolus TaxID=1242148 RepID=A0A2T6BU49_9BACL|nr:hypothetical protein [Melghirimyces profundicolus]PTX59584.1 hypothetical protein C8P63_11114 [Melghirimyces profundicolus]
MNEARGIAYAKDNPEVKFEVTHDLKTKEDTDTYHIDFWSHQIKKEFNEDIKQSIQANPDYILVYVEKDRLDPQEFPYWQDVLPH